MDETEGTVQDTTSAGQEGTTSQETKTYTEEEKRKAVSDALAEKGRDAQSFDKREAGIDARLKAIESQEREMDTWRRQREQEELDRAKDDPSLLSAYQMRHEATKEKAQLAKEKAELEGQRTELTDQRTELGKMMAELTAEKLAPTTSLTAEELMELSDGKLDRMKSLAKKFPKAEGTSQTTTKADSGMTTGGKTTLTADQVKKMSAQERWDKREEIAKIPLGLG